MGKLFNIKDYGKSEKELSQEIINKAKKLSQKQKISPTPTPPPPEKKEVAEVAEESTVQAEEPVLNLSDDSGEARVKVEPEIEEVNPVESVEVAEVAEAEKVAATPVEPVAEPESLVVESEPVVEPVAQEKPAPTPVNIVAPSEIKLVVPFMVKFLEHMGIIGKDANLKRKENVEKNLELIIKEAWKTEKITNDDVERVTGVRDRQALNYLKELVKRGKLRRFGDGAGVYYKPLR